MASQKLNRKSFVTKTPREVASRTFRFVASSEAKDRDGDIILLDGWKTDQFMKNPVVLVGHKYDSLPVARVSRLWRTPTKLMVDIAFPEEGVSKASDEAYGLIKAGILGAVSVGFRPLAHRPSDDGELVFTSVELMEISLVSVPSNPEALIAAALGMRGKRGVSKADLARAVAEGFRESVPKGIPRSEAAGIVETEVGRALLAKALDELAYTAGVLDADGLRKRMEVDPRVKAAVRGVVLAVDAAAKEVGARVRGASK